MIEGLIKFTDRRIFSLPCVKGCGSPVETSAFNAEAPTEPAGETVGCRRQLGGIVRLILYEFIKSLSHFLFQKNDSSLYKGAFVGQPQGLFLRFNIFFNPCEAPTSFHSSLFTLHFSLFSARQGLPLIFFQIDIAVVAHLDALLA